MLYINPRCCDDRAQNISVSRLSSSTDFKSSCNCCNFGKVEYFWLWEYDSKFWFLRFLVDLVAKIDATRFWQKLKLYYILRTFRCCRSKLGLHWHAFWQRWTRHSGHARLQQSDQTHANEFQAPSAQNDEELLCYQSQSWRERSQTIVTEDWITKEGIAGKIINLHYYFSSFIIVDYLPKCTANLGFFHVLNNSEDAWISMAIGK